MLNKKGWIAVGGLAAALLCACVWTGWYLGRRSFRVEAIKAGHAKHVIINELGHTDFEWLEKGDK